MGGRHTGSYRNTGAAGGRHTTDENLLSLPVCGTGDPQISHSSLTPL